MVTREEYVAGLHEVFDPIADTVSKHHPKATHWGDGAFHYYGFGNGTYIQVPDPMGDGGVHTEFRNNLIQAGTEIVEWQGPTQPLADPFMFGHRIDWSDRP
jgi:hypothetical protein